MEEDLFLYQGCVCVFTEEGSGLAVGVFISACQWDSTGHVLRACLRQQWSDNQLEWLPIDSEQVNFNYS
jgi:hypothetical protein